MPTFAENRNASRNCRSNSEVQNSQVKPGSRPNVTTPTLCSAVMVRATARNRKMNPAPGRISRKMVTRGRISGDYPDAFGIDAERQGRALLRPQVIFDLSAEAVAIHVKCELRDAAAEDDLPHRARQSIGLAVGSHLHVLRAPYQPHAALASLP